MTSKEIIKRIISFDNPPRIGLDFNEPHKNDIAMIPVVKLINRKFEMYREWGYYPDVLARVPNFSGEILVDSFGNIFGRLNGKTKGECIKGALEDSWELFSGFEMPEIDESYDKALEEVFESNNGRFILGALPVAVFSTLRDLRKIDNALMDTVLEKDMVLRFLEKITEFGVRLIKRSAEKGFDGIIIYDDWGTQHSLLVSPASWREIFKPAYKKLADEAHANSIKFFVHSCGYVYEIIEDLIEAGVDVLQFDQPELLGVQRLAENFGGRVTLWCPVDIQKIIEKGDRKLIESEALKMTESFKKYCRGFIAMDYGAWDDIGVRDEWAQWARDVFIDNAEYSA